jgi:hypothetical protein
VDIGVVIIAAGCAQHDKIGALRTYECCHHGDETAAQHGAKTSVSHLNRSIPIRARCVLFDQSELPGNQQQNDQQR